MSHLLFDIKDHVATLTFNQPEKRNAYSPEMAVKLTQYLRDCDQDPDVRAVIITGKGDAFCVGLDLNDVRERGESDEPPSTQGHPTQRVLRTYPFQISKPVICAINGSAGGFGALNWHRENLGPVTHRTQGIWQRSCGDGLSVTRGAARGLNGRSKHTCSGNRRGLITYRCLHC